MTIVTSIILKGLRIGVIVNDMANVNVDSKTASISTDGNGVVSLDNGCVCCELRSSLTEEVRRMVSTQVVDVVVIECSGIAEPRRVAAGFSLANNPEASSKTNAAVTERSESYRRAVQPQGESGMHLLTEANEAANVSKFELDTLVTVVDCEGFLERLTNAGKVGENEAFRKGEGAAAQDAREIADLLVDQVEVADVVVLNKTDLVPPEKLDQLKLIISSFNPRARIVSSLFGQANVDDVLRTGLRKVNEATGDSLRTPESQFSSTLSGKAGITSFVFRSRRPLHPVRLHNLVVKWEPTNVIRSKGYLCVAGSDSEGFSTVMGGEQVFWGHGKSLSSVLDC